jgi:Orsellinic acid/F9775 biosynthesis cluster protein D
MSDMVKILPELFLPVCMFPSCLFAVRTDYLAAHLKDFHAYSNEQAVSIVHEVRMHVGATVHSQAEKEKAATYLSAGSAENEGGTILEPLSFLRIAEGRQCLFCPYRAVSVDTLFKHAMAKHNKEAKSMTAANMFRSATKMNLQSVFGGSKKRWFEVSFCAAGLESDSCPVRFMKDFHGAPRLDHIGEDSSRMNAFLATIRFDIVL